jgi:hypothetical protein
VGEEDREGGREGGGERGRESENLFPDLALSY